MKHMQPIPRLAAVGDNCMDVYDRTGEAYPGGNPVNVAVYTLRLGGAASYTGVVGTDAYGPRMRAAIAAKGVDVSHLRTEPGKTAVSHVELVNGDRVFGDYDEGVMEHFRMTEDDLDFLASHDLVVSGLWGHTGPDLYKLKARGALVAFDCADKLEDPRLDEALPHVDYAFFSHDGSDEAVRAYLQTVLAKGPSLAASYPVPWWTPWGRGTALSPGSCMAGCGGRTSPRVWPRGPSAAASPWATAARGNI